MKKIILICFVILLISNISAIIINEVEMNPLETDTGKEWVELYNNGEDVNISGWEVWEGMVSGLVNPKKILTISERAILQAEGYLIIEFNNKLNNEGDYVILKDSFGNEIDKTETLEDSSRSPETWQLCGSSWKFASATKSEQNNCETNK